MTGPALHLSAEQRRALLTAADPLRLPESQALVDGFRADTELADAELADAEPTDGSPARAAGLVADTFAGDVTAARALRSAYAATTRELARALGLEPPDASAQVALDSHLLRLPVLATVDTDPAAALWQWALVGLREVLGAPVPYPRRVDVDPAAAARFERTVVAAVSTTVGIKQRIRLALGVSSEDVGRWTGAVTPLTVRGAGSDPADEGGSTGSGLPADGRLLGLARLADTFSAVLRADRVVPAFRSSPVPLLGGLTYGQALDAGWDVDVLTDVVRHGGGRRPVTAAGVAYLDGPHAPALAVLARYEQGGRS